MSKNLKSIYKSLEQSLDYQNHMQEKIRNLLAQYEAGNVLFAQRLMDLKIEMRNIEDN